MSTAFVNNRIIYRIVSSILLIVCILILIHLTPNLFKPEFLPSDDFFHFWGAGNQNLHGENPFDPEKIVQIKLQEGSLSSETYSTSIMLNPPWTISLLMPFGSLNYLIGRLAWLIFSILLVLLSSQLLWSIYSGAKATLVSYAGGIPFCPNDFDAREGTNGCFHPDRYCWISIFHDFGEMTGWQGYPWRLLR